MLFQNIPFEVLHQPEGVHGIYSIPFQVPSAQLYQGFYGHELLIGSLTPNFSLPSPTNLLKL